MISSKHEIWLQKHTDKTVFVFVALYCTTSLLGLHEKIIIQFFFPVLCIFASTQENIFKNMLGSLSFLGFLVIFSATHFFGQGEDSFQESVNFLGPLVLFYFCFSLSKEAVRVAVLFSIIVSLSVYYIHISTAGSSLPARFSIMGVHPNAYGPMLVPLVGYLFVTSTRLLSEIINFFLFLATGGVLYLTNSRTSLFAYFTTFLIVMLVKRGKVAFLALFFVGALSIGFFFSQDGARIARIKSAIENPLEDRTFLSRKKLWLAAFDMIKKSPLSGGGVGKFKEEYSKLSAQHPSQFPEKGMEQPHNLILEVWVGAGLLGLLGIALVSIDYLRMLKLRLAIPMVTFLPILLMIATFEPGLYQSEPVQFGYAFVFGLGAAQIMYNKEREHVSKSNC